MAKVTNHSDVLITLPVTGQQVRPGATIRADRWNIVKGAETVRAWISAGALTAIEGVEDAIALAPATAESAEVDIPADWRGMSWNERRSLASRFSAEPVRNGDEAEAVILAELARRED